MARSKKLQVNPTGSASLQLGNAPVSVSANLAGNTGIGAKLPVGDLGHLNVSAGMNVFSGLPSGNITPVIGNGPDADLAASIGSAIGGPVLGPVTAAVASGVFGGSSSEKTKEHKARNSVLNAYKSLGLFDDNYSTVYPDGTTFDFQGGSGQTHAVKDPSKLVSDIGGRDLHGYETDYTNDLDYLASMYGTTLSRILAGGSGKPIDQTGQLMGNSFLGALGYGQDLNQQNFNKVTENARALFAKSKITSKEDLLGLANQLYSQGKVNDVDYAGMQNAANLLYDDNYNLATTLMQNRWKGINTAAKSPGQTAPTPTQAHGGMRSPFISLDEAIQSWQPLMDWYHQQYPRAGKRPPMGTAATITQGLGMITGLGAAYHTVDKIFGGGISSGMRDAASIISGGVRSAGSALADQLGLGGGSAPSAFDFPAFSFDTSSAADVGSSIADISAADLPDFPTNLDFSAIF